MLIMEANYITWNLMSQRFVLFRNAEKTAAPSTRRTCYSCLARLPGVLQYTRSLQSNWLKSHAALKCFKHTMHCIMQFYLVHSGNGLAHRTRVLSLNRIMHALIDTIILAKNLA